MIFIFSRLFLCGIMLLRSMRLTAQVMRGAAPRNSLQHFILFLPQGRKRTKQEKEAAARAKFASAHGAPPLSLKCLRHLFTKLLLQDAFLPLKAARRVGAPRRSALSKLVGAEPANFAQAGPLALDFAIRQQIKSQIAAFQQAENFFVIFIFSQPHLQKFARSAYLNC